MAIDKEAIPVTIVGLENAGKTTLIERLKHDKFVEDTTPTIGVSFEIFDVDNTRFKIFDLGGQLVFREQFWIKYASYSYGIVFVFDAADRQKLADAKKWYWKLIDELEVEDRIAIAFLANKADLDGCMSLQEIIDELELTKMGEHPAISFQIFKTSNKTAENISQFVEWFERKINNIAKARSTSPKGLILSTIYGRIQFVLDFSDLSEQIDLVRELLMTLYEEQKDILKTFKLTSMIYKDVKLVCNEKADMILSLITHPTDSDVEAQRYIDIIYEFISEKKAKTKDELTKFIFDLFNVPESKRKELNGLSF